MFNLNIVLAMNKKNPERDSNYPFARLHMHEEDAKWLYRRWQKYQAAVALLESEREKGNPNRSVINNAIYDLRQHRQRIIETIKGKSKSANRMLQKAFGKDLYFDE